MAFTKKNSFAGGSNGTTITTANSGGDSGDAFDLVSGSPTYTSTNATGSRGPLVASMPASSRLSWNITLGARTLYVRMYTYRTSNPGSNAVLWSPSASQPVRLRITTAGKLEVLNNQGITVATSTNALPLNQWVRVEVMVTIGTTTSNGAAEVRVYHSADSTTITETLTVSATNFGTSLPSTCDFWGFADLTLDDVAASDVDWIGPNQLDAEATPDTLTGAWSLPAPGISTGSTIQPATLTGVWALPEPEIATANGLTAVNPDTLAGTWTLPTPAVAAFKNVLVEPSTLVGTWEVQAVAAGVPVNPGDSITGPGQVEWNGFLFDGATYRPQQLDGWVTDMPGLDNGNVPQPSRHGSYPGRKLAQERIVTLSGLITATPDSIEQAIEDLIQATPILEDDTELPLAVRLINKIYVGYGSVTRRSIPLDLIGTGKAKVTIQWTLSDPVLLSRELSSAVIADRTTQTLTNLGNAATYPLIRVPGPATNPAIEIQRSGGQARVLEFDTTVPSGQTLIIDTYYGTAILGGADVISTLSGTSVPVFDLVLAAGQNTVTYDGGGSAAAITVLWRHAYL